MIHDKEMQASSLKQGVLQNDNDALNGTLAQKALEIYALKC